MRCESNDSPPICYDDEDALVYGSANQSAISQCNYVKTQHERLSYLFYLNREKRERRKVPLVFIIVVDGIGEPEIDEPLFSFLHWFGGVLGQVVKIPVF
jgi:hypothetical protein